MRIATLKITNWLCYRGEHVLHLEPKVYAIVARKEDDVERSNWLGKTSLLETIPFALYGQHRFRTEDEFITRGEHAAEIEITFDDGTVIRRRRERGKRTTVHFALRGDWNASAMQKEAEAQIETFVGLSWADFRATCFFEQRQMARFVLADPSDRMKMVAAWLKLEPLERAEERAKKLAREVEDRAKEIDGALKALDERAKQLPTREEIATQLPEQEKAIEEAAGAVATFQDAITKNATLMAARSQIDSYDTTVAEGKKVRALLDARKLPVLQSEATKRREALTEKDVELGQLRRDLEAKARLARGQFDGACPVAGIACPAKDSINAERARNEQLAQDSKAKHDAAAIARHEAATAAVSAEAALQEAQRLEARLKALREQAAALAPAAKHAREAGEPKDPQALRGLLQNAQGVHLSLRDAATNLRRSLEEHDRIEKNRAALETEREKLGAVLGVHREAVVIFGKKGAQRRVAEGALAQIEDDANKVLQECGVRLTVEVRWAREGSGLAKSCDACGHPFPSSVKVKACERCGAGRGPQLENKLEISLSDRSGAAEDLAGAAVQLAASRWLRDVRACAWTSAFLDEPFGALDAAHRRAFSTHLAAMIRGRYGFEQAFVVAHHASVLDALPGRIEIVAGANGSAPRVVA